MKKTLLFILLCIAGSATAERKPNILFIAIDDMNDWTGFLGGHPQAITPNMDDLASRGVNFTNAHCSAPGCSPSRNSLLFGIEPFRSGLYAFYDHAGFSKELMSPYLALTEFFKQNGYETYGSGKIHHRRDPTSNEWTEFYDHKARKRPALRFDVSDGYRVGKDGKLNFSPTLNPLEDHNDHRNTSFGVEVLQREHEKPFFLAVGLVKPHLPFVAPKRFFDLYPKDVKSPRINANDWSDIPAVGRAMAKVGDDRRFKKDNAWAAVRRAYLACISWVDYNVGRLIDALEASPYVNNTIVVLWSDHGFALGEKRHFRKFALWEETTRVPFIIWDARSQGVRSNGEVKQGVSLINIYRTVAELAGLIPPEYVDGFSLVPHLKDTSMPLSKPSICTWGRGNYTLRDANWRFTQYYDGTQELYEHSTDPDEWINQAGNIEYAEIKERMSAFLPKIEVPLIYEGLEEWSVPVSADKPLNAKKK